VEQALEDTQKVVADHRLEIELTKQAVATIKDDISDMKRVMSNFIEELKKNYVPRTEYHETVERLKTMENRIWALIVTALFNLLGFATAIVLLVVKR
jgi:hypothetical protein